MKKLEHFIYTIIQAFLWLQILIFSTYIFYPKTIVNGTDAEGWLRELAAYHASMQKIFLVYTAILLIIFFVLLLSKRMTKIFYFYPALAVFTTLFAYFATRGHTWYFYGNSGQTINSTIMATVCLLLSFSFIYVNKLLIRKKHKNSNNLNK